MHAGVLLDVYMHRARAAPAVGPCHRGDRETENDSLILLSPVVIVCELAVVARWSTSGCSRLAASSPSPCACCRKITSRGDKLMSSGAPVGCLARASGASAVSSVRGSRLLASSDGGCCRGLGVVDSPKWASADGGGAARTSSGPAAPTADAAGRAGCRGCSDCRRLEEVVSDACRGRAGARSPANTPAALARERVDCACKGSGWFWASGREPSPTGRAASRPRATALGARFACVGSEVCGTCRAGVRGPPATSLPPPALPRGSGDRLRCRRRAPGVRAPAVCLLTCSQ